MIHVARRLLPQEASYYAIRLPHGWWLFGLDLALVEDIDMMQCRCALSPKSPRSAAAP